MTFKTLLTLAGVCLPVLLLLLDRLSLKKKDARIASLTSEVSALRSEKKTAQQAEKLALQSSQRATSSATQQTANARASTDLLAEARAVSSIADALALAKKQVENNNR